MNEVKTFAFDSNAREYDNWFARHLEIYQPDFYRPEISELIRKMNNPL